LRHRCRGSPAAGFFRLPKQATSQLTSQPVPAPPPLLQAFAVFLASTGLSLDEMTPEQETALQMILVGYGWASGSVGKNGDWVGEWVGGMGSAWMR